MTSPPRDAAEKLRITALDQDIEALPVIIDDYKNLHIKNIPDSILSILKPSFSGKYDLIYSAGLFDYLDDRLACKLVTRLCQLLSKRGTLSIGNFLPKSHGRGYMEGIMEWSLIYRSMNEKESFASGIGSDFRVRSFEDEISNVGYLEIVRT